jgi:hypothetical protein
MQSVVFVSPNDAGPLTEIPLPDGEIVVRPKIFVPGETDDWSEDSCNDAFEALAGLPSQEYFPLLSYSICFIDLTREEFFKRHHTIGLKRKRPPTEAASRYELMHHTRCSQLHRRP